MSQIPLPRPTQHSKPYWDRCQAGELAAPRCDGCGNLFFPPRAGCPRCLNPDVTYEVSSGKGIVYSFTRIDRAPGPEFETPYVVAIVEVEEGWHLGTHIIGCDPEEVDIGMAVEVDFRKMSDEITLPFFRPSERNSE